MSSEQFDLFLILLKLKLYLVSLVVESENAFEFTEEFLERKYPERKKEVMELLNLSKIHSDVQIAFDEKIHLKFRDMIQVKESAAGLSEILERFNIESIRESNKEKALYEIKNAREDKIKQIVALLFQLARIWTQRSELENNVEDFSLLEEEELIRPEEQQQLGRLDDDTMISFSTISKLSHFYLELLIDYYFQFGGDIALPEFVKGLEEFKNAVESKYKDLFKKSGLQ
jgi:hypothetical protein